MKNPLIHLGLSALLVVVALGGYWFAHHALGTRSARSAELLAAIDATRSAKESNELAAKRLESVDTARQAVAGYFVAADEVVGFLERLEDTGQSFGASVEVASVSDVQKPRQGLLIALKISGPFAAVMKSIAAIEYGPHDVIVSALTLDTDAGEETVGTWRATMNLTVGTASSTPSLPTPTAPAPVATTTAS